ncbi:TetR family transcriptional regulator [Bacillus suaedaesalsae]|uniref:TetR family transcriptional regulator n=1 Tax=Bacillus suaedaesalsae TaxID=2810349 RepID=A0ABS2DGJ2_9BACI|nr:TetR family transcriptional regulator [Bacillus suaedaesalsae]
MKEKITEQAILLFEKNGFSETSIQDIVNHLHVTKGTFYYYFTSKEELLMDIHNGYIDDVLKRQDQILKERNKSCKEKLYEIVFMLISIIESQGESARVFFREMKNLSEEHKEDLIKKREIFRNNLQELLEEGKDKKEFHEDLSSDIVSFGILGMTNWSYQWFKPNGKKSDQEVAKIFTDMVLKGISI